MRETSAATAQRLRVVAVSAIFGGVLVAAGLSFVAAPSSGTVRDPENPAYANGVLDRSSSGERVQPLRDPENPYWNAATSTEAKYIVGSASGLR